MTAADRGAVTLTCRVPGCSSIVQLPIRDGVVPLHAAQGWELTVTRGVTSVRCPLAHDATAGEAS